MPLPPRSNELDRQQNVRQYLRRRCLSSRVFARWDAIRTAICQAWNTPIEEPDRIAATATRLWAAG